jgi:rod shape determining protein RodA
VALKIKTFEPTLVVVPILLLVTSISVIYSLVYSSGDLSLVYKQGISSLIGLLLMAILSFFDYRFFRGTSWILYAISILLLLYVDFFGMAAGGAMRWIDLGFFQLQPSEIAKVVVIVSLASFFASRREKITWLDLLKSFGIIIPPLALILKEPDLGTALVISFIYIVLLFMAKPSRIQTVIIFSSIFIVLSAGILAAFNITPFKGLMHDYQRNRILTFVDPNLDPYGKGYNVKQAQITVGSGGILGRGLGKGTQSQLQFLPKAQTDFIFSGIAESFGFLGSLTFLTLLAYLIIKIVGIGAVARDEFGMFVAIGAAAMFSFQIFVNVGMNIGLTPVTGIPLPFASYGGSALVAYLFLVGLVQSVFIRHKKISFE